MFNLIKLILIVSLFVLTPGVSAAQAVSCFPYEVATKSLKETYGEFQLFQGVTGDSEILELWLNKTTGSWTVFILNLNGQACLKAAGQSHALTLFHGPTNES